MRETEPPPAGRSGPLAGFRVIDFSENMAGPFGTLVLADQGAAILLPQTGLSPESLAATLRTLDRPRLLDMATKARALGKPEAAKLVAARCMELAG